MYLLLCYTIEPGQHNPVDIEADVTARLASISPQCPIAPGVILMPSTGGDGEYADLLDDMLHIRNYYDGQLRFALVKSRERYFRGDGYDTVLAEQIVG